MNEQISVYFDEENAIAATGMSMGETLSAIVNRYLGQNPPVGFRFRGFRTDGFRAGKDGCFDLNLLSKLPHTPNGWQALAATRFRVTEAGTHTVQVSCYSKVELYCNGERVWRSSPREEQDSDRTALVDLPCKQGWNTLLLLCRKTASGFGCRIGAANPNWFWLSFLAPFREREGQGGFAWSEAFDEAPTDLCALDASGAEASTGLSWYPEKERAADGDLHAILGGEAGDWACVWTRIVQARPAVQRVSVCAADGTLYLDGQELTSDSISLSCGEHDLLLIVQRKHQEQWSYSITAKYEDGTLLGFRQPRFITGCEGHFLCLGPLKEKPSLTAPTLYGLPVDGTLQYWKSGPQTAVRPYLHNTLFGRWNYPLGVTLYGLTQSARLLQRQEWMTYIAQHIGMCVSLHDYSLWDRDTYGYPEINNQIVALSSLDDCGSFGSAMLEFADGKPDPQTKAVADRIAAHISTGQSRLADGALYRKEGDGGTLWIDDLYMSIPFLCRYAALTGEARYLDDAATQILLYKKYLFLSDSNVMSHVYNCKLKMDTKIPWGRGNGWCLFSMTELLAVLPEDHPQRNALLDFFRTLCEGTLALQGSRGLWHQVLTHFESYEEASCTAMFTYAYCRAVRYGWVEPALSARLWEAATRAWEGLCRVSIDCFGNIYGICKGSSYAFTPDYYRDELGWMLNDPHGTGIVLLAGIEMQKTQELGASHKETRRSSAQ